MYLLLMSYLVSLFVLQFSVFTDDGPAQFVQAAGQHACFDDLNSAESSLLTFFQESLKKIKKLKKNKKD